MEIDIGGGLRAKINLNNSTASIVKSTKQDGTVLIPSFVNFENKQYKIVSLSGFVFSHTHIDYLTFPEDSEVETFERDCFHYAYIKKLKIPPKLKNLRHEWCQNFHDLTEIEISPKNKLFTFYDNKYLLGKREETSDEFDILYFACFGFEDYIIPSHVKIIEEYSFYERKELRSITFEKNSKLEIIKRPFDHSQLRKLILPISIQNITDDTFYCNSSLIEIYIPPGNPNYTMYEDKYLLTKTKNDINEFDQIFFARRDIENVVIPPNIRIIGNAAFCNCKNIKSLNFGSNSLLTKLISFSFKEADLPEKIVLPPSLKHVDMYSFHKNIKLKYVEFLGKSITIDDDAFNDCENLIFVTFTNANDVILNGERIFDYTSPELKIYVRHNTNLSGNGMKKYKNLIEYIREKLPKLDKFKDKDKKVSSNKILPKPAIENVKEKKDLERYICFLQQHLKKYEQITPIDEFLKKKEKFEDGPKVLIGPNEEKYQKIECKIGEGTTSDVFKVKDTRTGQVMCKKVIKENKEEEYIKTFRNSIKEIEVALLIKHPCICECFGYNLQEEINKSDTNKEEEQEEDEEEEEVKKKTTIAIFVEYLPFSVKNVIDNKMMNNTLKVKIAVEVAFGMKHIHGLGMIHRDLKLENIMLNAIFESKIIDFDLVHLSNSESIDSLAKGIGTLAYMSPEMLNEKEYNNKTDVYSYGIVLFVLFTGRLPKQSIREKLDKVPLKFPKVSSKISQYCINLIKKCTFFDPKKRPTFEKIIIDMEKNSFLLASEIDTKAIMNRYKELNRFDSCQNHMKKKPKT